MPCHCEGVCTSATMGGALVGGSPRDIKWGELFQKSLIFMHFHGVSLGNQHEIWSKQHNGKVRLYLRVFRGVSKLNLPGYVGFFQFLRNFRHQNAFGQAELILQAALDPAVASRARRGELVKCLDHFDLLQTAIN